MSRILPLTLHSHSGQFCFHAKGALENVVKMAIKKNFVCIGLTEHMFRTRNIDLYEEEKNINVNCDVLKKNWLEFVKEARRLQSKYSDKINILVGSETENIHSGTISEIKEAIKEHPLDYLVGSVHHVNEIPIDITKAQYETAVKSLPEQSYDALFQKYFDAQYQVITELKPMVIGHFDLIRIFAPSNILRGNLSEEVWEKIKRNVKAVNDYGGVFEVNARAWKKGLPYAYPFKDILQYIISTNAKITLSDDSHDPLEVGLNYEKLYEYLEGIGIQTVYYFKIDKDTKKIIPTPLNINKPDSWKV